MMCLKERGEEVATTDNDSMRCWNTTAALRRCTRAQPLSGFLQHKMMCLEEWGEEVATTDNDSMRCWNTTAGLQKCTRTPPPSGFLQREGAHKSHQT